MGARDAHWGDMDHTRIDEDLIADRYLLGKLPDEERRRFEEHFVDCARCVETLETLGGLRRGLRELPAGETATVHGEPPSVPAISPPVTPPPSIAWLLAACLLLAVPASVVFYLQARRAADETAAARSASGRAERRSAELERTLERERAAARTLSASAAAASAQPVAAAVFRLDLVRDAGSSEPSNRVVVDGGSEWVALLFDRPERPGITACRVRLSGSDGRPVGEAIAAGAAPGGMLAASFPAKLLPPGDYVLGVEEAGSARTGPLATYRFRVVRR